MPWPTVRREEVPATAFLSMGYFFVIAGFTLGKIARDSLFLTELPAQYLPYIYIGIAVISAVAVALLSRLEQFSTRAVLTGLLVATAASFGLFQLWFQADPESAAIALYFWTAVYGLTLVSQFWLLANELVDTRQARRLFGVVGAGGIAGGLIGGVVATATAERFPPNVLLILSALSFLTAAAMIWRWGAHDEEQVSADETVSEHSVSDDDGDNRYLRLIVVVFLLAGMVSGILDYAFKLVLQQSLAETGAITSTLGVFYSAQSAVSLVAQLGLAGYIITRFGSRVAPNALPAGILLGSLMTLSLPAAVAGWAMIGTRFYETTMRLSLVRVSWQFLYYPMTDGVRRRAKLFVDVFVNRSAEAVAGMLLLVVNATLGGTLNQLAILVALLAAAWLFLEWRLNHAYQREVSASLGRLAPGRDTERLSLKEVADGLDLQPLLESDSTDEVLHALNVAESVDAQIVIDAAPQLMQHRSRRVRSRLLAVLVAEGVDTSRYEELLSRSPPAPVEEAETWGLAESTPERAFRVAAATTRSAQDRATLLDAMDDPDTDLRRIAYSSAVLAGDRSLVTVLIQRLAQPSERRVVRQALVKWGPPIAGTLGDHLIDDDVDLTLRLLLVTVLAEIGGQDVVFPLYNASSPHRSQRVANAALQALHRVRERDPEVRLPQQLILDDLAEDAPRYVRLLQSYESSLAIEDEPLRQLAVRVFREESARGMERIFRRMALVYPARRTMQAFDALSSPHQRVRAQAIEYLDTNLPAATRSKLVPLLDARDDLERAQLAGELLGRGAVTIEDTIDEFLASPESWYVACGLFGVGRLHIAARREEVEARNDDNNFIVRDTARWAIRRLGSGAE